jgi:hypothetical protein
LFFKLQLIHQLEVKIEFPENMPRGPFEWRQTAVPPLPGGLKKFIALGCARARIPSEHGRQKNNSRGLITIKTNFSEVTFG